MWWSWPEPPRWSRARPWKSSSPKSRNSSRGSPMMAASGPLHDSNHAARKLRAAIFAHSTRAPFEKLRDAIARTFDVVLVDTDGTADLSQLDVELLFVLGGDGSMLRAARRMGVHQRQGVGVNLGRLRFLADLTPEALTRSLPALAAGQYRIVPHLMFDCWIRRGDEVLRTELGLNEVAVLAGPPFSMLDIDLYVDGELATTY